MKDTLVKAMADDFRIYAARTTHLVGDAVPEGFVRGYVEYPHVSLPLNAQGKLDVGAGVGAGLLTVTRFTGLKEPVAGSSEIITGEIAEDLTRYLYDSEQTPSSIALGVLVAPDLSVLAAGGFFVQPLPGASEESLSRMEENLAALPAVSDMVHQGMTAREIAERVMQGLGETQVLAQTDLAFRCSCSKERVEGMLLSLSHDDLASLVADGKAEVCCHFCGEKYAFSREDLETLLTEKERSARG